MSSAPTDCRVPDPSDKLDAKADGQFQQVNRRAGYGDDRLDRIIATARKGWTLAAGEGLVLVQEIDRLRDDLKYAQALLNQLHDSERLQDEIDRLRKGVEVAAEEQEMVRDAITVHGGCPTVELVRFSQSGIWVNPDIPIDEVAQQVFALLEPMIVKSYTKAAAAAEREDV